MAREYCALLCHIVTKVCNKLIANMLRMLHVYFVGKGPFKYIERSKWGALSSKSKMDNLRQAQPLKYIIISHTADEDIHSSTPVSSEILTAMQRSAFARGMR